MDEFIAQKMKAFENPLQTGPYPEIQTNTPLAMFLKRSVDEGILYTNVQDQKISYFFGQNYNQLHQNASLELVYVLEGTVIKTIEDKQYTLRTGEGYILNRRIAHSEELPDGFLLCLNFTEELFKQITIESEINFDQHPVFNFIRHSQTEQYWQKSYLEFNPTVPLVNHQFRIVLDALQQELATNKLGANYLQKGLLLRLLELLENPHMFNLNPINIHSNKEEFLVDRLTSFIIKRYGDVSRKDIEVQLHYNNEYLNRLLKKACGKTINAYASEVRLDRAKELLTSTNLTINQITELLNFSSDNYFYQFFKKNTGLSPRQYRQQH